MNLINSQTMSSREIAELTKKQHQHVKRDIANMLAELDLDPSKYGRTYLDALNRSQTEYFLDKELTETLITGYSVKLRHVIIKRWNELESQAPALPDFSNPVEAARAWADAKESELKALAQIEADKPKIEVYERLADRKGDVSTTVLAKQLGTTAIKLNRWLREIGAKWQQADLPKAGYQDWFNVVADVKNGHEFTQCLVTPEGQLKIAEKWGATK